MNRKRLLLAAVLLISLVCLTVAVYYYVQFKEPVKPSWLELAAYVTYEQVFVWNGHNQTEHMTWNLTGLSDDSVDLHVASHGISSTLGNVVIVSGEVDWTINAFTREIVRSSDSTYVNKKCAFWIETSVGIGSAVDTIYGANTISKNEVITVLGQERDCWVLEYNWPTSSMKRWYDKLSGICLEIYVVLHRQGVVITTTETAVLTNI